MWKVGKSVVRLTAMASPDGVAVYCVFINLPLASSAATAKGPPEAAGMWRVNWAGKETLGASVPLRMTSVAGLSYSGHSSMVRALKVMVPWARAGYALKLRVRINNAPAKRGRREVMGQLYL